MSLLAEVTTALRRQHAPFAVTGAAALAVHGVSRATRADAQARGPINFIMHESAPKLIIGIFPLSGHPT